jgi:heterodisulfide reductase subunit A-like polyferredoxin
MKRDKRDQNSFSRRDFIKTAATGAGAAALTGLGVEVAKAEGRPAHWDKEADVVVIGAGATGLPAAIQAAEGGASVILIDANTDVGGHAILSGGNMALGGGTSRQKKYGVVDSPDLCIRT